MQLIGEAVSGQLEDSEIAQGWAAEGYPGQQQGLSRRESEILRLVVAGHGNQQIADALYLSINSVKTYIRSAYRKMDVTSRAQAVVWGIQHGFLTRPTDPHPLDDDAPVLLD